MSRKYPGGFVTKTFTPPTTSSANGVWTLDQVLQYQNAGIWPSPPPPERIQDFFTNSVYTGNGSSYTVTTTTTSLNTKGMVWIKPINTTYNAYVPVIDTVRGINVFNQSATLYTDSALGQSLTYDVTAINASSFTVGNATETNAIGATFDSWAFAGKAKFFDIVNNTYFGYPIQTFSHNLGSVPGFMIVKTLAASNNWIVYHKSLGPTKYIVLNGTGGEIVSSTAWANTAPTDTQFSLSTIFQSYMPFIAYLFADNAGGFGSGGADSVVYCGSYTGSGNSSQNINIGFEPQWVLVKQTTNTTGAENWCVFDSATGFTKSILVNTNSPSVATTVSWITPTATGFTLTGTTDSPSINSSSQTYIYVAIRKPQ